MQQQVELQLVVLLVEQQLEQLEPLVEQQLLASQLPVQLEPLVAQEHLLVQLVALQQVLNSEFVQILELVEFHLLVLQRQMLLWLNQLYLCLALLVSMS
jgi:hypothetical protein